MGISSVGGAGKQSLASSNDAPTFVAAEAGAVSRGKAGFSGAASLDAGAASEAAPAYPDTEPLGNSPANGTEPNNLSQHKGIDLSSVFTALENAPEKTRHPDKNGDPPETAKANARASKRVSQMFTNTQKLVDKYKFDSDKGTQLKISV